MGQHDASYRTLFSHPFLVESLIRGFLPGLWVQAFELATLEPVSEAHATEDWSVRYNDCVWRLRCRSDRSWVYLYLMLEFQRTAPPFMAVRIMSYTGVLHQHLVKALELKTDDFLPLLVPVVIYNGDAPWTPALDVFDLMPPAPPGMERYLPRLRYEVIDVRRLSLAALETMRNAAACMFRLEGSPDLEHTLPAVTDLDELLDRERHAALRHDLTRWVCEILLPSRLPGVTVNQVRNLEEVGSMLNENTIDWTAKWRLQGREEGREEGRREGEAVLLLRLMERKFGELKSSIRRKIEGADSERLLEWGERILTARSLAEVFSETE